MFLDFFVKLKDSKIPVSINEFLSFIHALQLDFIQFDVDRFYYLARTSLVKNERMLDRFDMIFAEYFKSIERIEIDDVIEFLKVPDEWLSKLFERHFSKEEINKIKSLGGLDKLIETLKKRIAEQEKRHTGGNKWIGTSGTSPFGAYGYNPEGIRIGQDRRRHGKAIKVWDKRIFKDLDDSRELDNRGFQVALKKLRRWARTGINDELDIEETIRDTAKNGYLDIKTRKERENSLKILLFLDVGGSMDEHVNQVEQLFTAAKNVFKNMKYFYFHNCLYESVWKDNRRRHTEKIDTWDILHKYSSDYKVIFVGDASMSPYEITYPGGSVEHWNEEAGADWLQRITDIYQNVIWINPVETKHWEFTPSTQIINQIISDRMYPLTLDGLDKGMKELSRNK